MPPTDTVKTSVRFSLEAIAIIDAYAATHKCNKTEALNALILASRHTHPELPPNNATPLPPSNATQDRQWQRSIEARLDKLEAATPLPPISATHVDPGLPQFEVGQEITGQSAKTYRLLWNSFEAEQKINRTTYYLSNKLGVICKVIGTSKAGKKKLSIWVTFPGDKVVIQDDGTFLTEKSNGKLGWETEEVEAAPAEASTPIEVVNDEVAIEAIEMPSTHAIEPAVKQVTEVVESLVETATQLPPTRLAKGELLERFATKLNNPGQLNTLKGNLDSVGLPKLSKGWAAQYDPEGKAWMPEDATREYWVEQTMEVAS